MLIAAEAAPTGGDCLKNDNQVKSPLGFLTSMDTNMTTELNSDNSSVELPNESLATTAKRTYDRPRCDQIGLGVTEAKLPAPTPESSTVGS